MIQGAAPAFDMTIARDRTIGILFGDLVVAIVFTQIWPVTIAGRIDPAIERLLRQLAAVVAATSAAERWGLAAEARTKPRGHRAGSRSHPLRAALDPACPGLAGRATRQSPRILSSLQGPLLIGADQEPAGIRWHGAAP